VKRLIVEVLAPLGDRVAQATTALTLNGFAWLLAHVYLLPENTAVRTITKTSIYASVLAFGVTLLYASMLGVISLLHGVPLSVVFSDVGKRRQYLKEAER
jgi:hypothetical protein